MFCFLSGKEFIKVNGDCTSGLYRGYKSKLNLSKQSWVLTTRDLIWAIIPSAKKVSPLKILLFLTSHNFQQVMHMPIFHEMFRRKDLITETNQSLMSCLKKSEQRSEGRTFFHTEEARLQSLKTWLRFSWPPKQREQLLSAVSFLTARCSLVRSFPFKSNQQKVRTLWAIGNFHNLDHTWS